MVIGSMLLSFLLVGCSLNPVDNHNRNQTPKTASTQIEFHTLTPQYEIEDYEYIADGNGIVIDWKITNQKELDMNDTESPDFLATSQAFIVRNNLRLRNITAEGSSEMKNDEYFYLDIFDLRGKTITKKQVDLWKLTQDYLKDDTYHLFRIEADSIYEENGTYHVSIGVKKDRKYRYLSLNLDTLVIDSEIPQSDIGLKAQHSFRLVKPKSGKEQVSKIHNQFGKKSSYQGNINLKNVSPSAFKLFDKKDATAYQLFHIKGHEITNAPQLLDLYSLFLDEGVSIYDVGVLGSDFTSDGQEHRITKYEDLELYIKKD